MLALCILRKYKYLDLLYFIIWLYIVGVGLQKFRLNSDILKA